MNDDPYAERQRLSFEQAENAEPLPRQLQPKEVSAELRAVLWKVMYESLYPSEQYDLLTAPWDTILEDEWVLHQHRMIDEYDICLSSARTP
jgi:hypothetical protein